MKDLSLNLFQTPDGSSISNWKEWQALRPQFRDVIVNTQYGALPPNPEKQIHELLCQSVAKRLAGGPKLGSYKIHCQGGEIPFCFTLRLLTPQGEGPFPVVILGDTCWWYANDEVVQDILAQGYAICMFNRTEMAKDLGGKWAPEPGWNDRTGGLYEVYPGQNFGALSAWAWGYHRCVDFLVEQPFIDKTKIAVSGHSRGGKTVLLAGASDERICVINDNASGTGGSALSGVVSENGETLPHILTQFPHWFAKDFSVGDEEVAGLPFDQHYLLASLAPRPVLMTYAKGDVWSNPSGMIRAVEVTRQIYELNGNSKDIAYSIREGAHAHTPEDFRVFLTFLKNQWS